MGFSWTAINVGDPIAAAHYNEMKDACDTTASAIGIFSFSWTSNSNISTGSLITSNSINELRDAVDYLDNNNYCSTHNSGENGSYFDNDNSTYYGTDDGTHQDGNNSTYYGTDDGTHQNGYNSGRDYTHDYLVDATENSTHESGHNNVQRHTYYSSNLQDQRDGVYHDFHGNDKTGVYGLYYSSRCNIA